MGGGGGDLYIYIYNYIYTVVVTLLVLVITKSTSDPSDISIDDFSYRITMQRGTSIVAQRE